MGKSSSSANNQYNTNQNHPPRTDSPASARTSSPSRGGSPAPSGHRVHRSLRTKKKSLELPDLASLTLTPANSSPASVSPHSNFRHPQASSPIPIPPSARPPPPRGFAPQNNLPSAAHRVLYFLGPASPRHSKQNRTTEVEPRCYLPLYLGFC